MRSSYVIAFLALTATVALAREGPRAVLFLGPTNTNIVSQTSSFSSSSVWAPGADGQMHEEVHEVQDQSASDGLGITHFSRGIKACRDGDCSHSIQQGRVIPQALFASEAQGAMPDPMSHMIQGMLSVAQGPESQGDDEMVDAPQDVMQGQIGSDAQEQQDMKFMGVPLLQSMDIGANDPTKVMEEESIAELAAPESADKPEKAKTTPESPAPVHVVKSSATLSAGAPQVLLEEPAAPTTVGKAEKVAEANATPEPASTMHVVEGTTTLSSAPFQEDTNAGIAEMMSLDS